MAFWAYLLRCTDGSYYAGHADDLEQRIGQHQTGAFSGYTYKRRPVELVWSQDFTSRIEALETERQIKGCTRAKKQALIAGDWKPLSSLARSRDADRRPSTNSGLTDGERGSPTLSSAHHRGPR